MKTTKTARKAKTLFLAQNAVLAAIVVLMAFTPIGYLRLGAVETTFIMIPVAVGAIALGEKSGAFLGLVFGISSFIQCFGISPFGAALLQINPIFTFIMCLVPRILMGYLCGASHTGKLVFTLVHTELVHKVVCLLGKYAVGLKALTKSLVHTNRHKRISRNAKARYPFIAHFRIHRGKGIKRLTGILGL